MNIFKFLIIFFIFFSCNNNNNNNNNNVLFVESIYTSPSLYTFNRDTINYFGSFGFLKGGKFSLKAIKKPVLYKDVLNDTSLFGLCTFDQLYDIGDINPCGISIWDQDSSNKIPHVSMLNIYNNTDSSDNSNNNNINNNNNNNYNGVDKKIINKCQFINLSTLNETDWSGIVNETNYYSYVYFSCFKGTKSINIEISYENLNPNGNHLSMEFRFFPSTYLAFVIAWSILSILWFVNWLQNRDKSSRLHFIISLIPISTLIDLIYSLLYYQFIKTDGALSLTVTVFKTIFYSLSLVILLLVLMVISMGYGIVPKNFKRARLLILLIGIIIFVGTFIGSFYSGQFNYVVLITYLPVALFIIFVAQNNIKRIRMILKIKEASNNSSNNNISSSNSNSNSNNNNNNNNNNNGEISDLENDVNRIRSIYYLFISFKWIMVPYVLITIIISIVSIYIYEPWIFLFIQLLLNLILFFMIALTFRLKKTKKHSFYEFFDENTFKSNELE